MLPLISNSQPLFDWKGDAPDGNWKRGADGGRWFGTSGTSACTGSGCWDEPPFGILRFNNNSELNMNNNILQNNTASTTNIAGLTVNAYNFLADKIKTIETDNMLDDTSINTKLAEIGGDIRPEFNESAIIMSSEEDEIELLSRKYGIDKSDNSDLVRQNEAFKKILDPTVPEIEQVNVQKVEVNRDIDQQPIQRVNIEDPIISMFKNVKRNVEFNVNVDISDKIPRLDFIEMMEDSYNTSIIDFLAQEFTDEIIKDPTIIKEKIKDKLMDLVYPEVDNKKKSHD